MKNSNLLFTFGLVGGLLSSFGGMAQTPTRTYPLQAATLAYFEDPRGADFNVNLTLDRFQMLPASLRAVALADLIAQPDYTIQGDGEEGDFQVRDRALIMRQYYDNARPELKALVQAWAFDIALAYSSNNAQSKFVQKYFDQNLTQNPRLAMQRLCSGISSHYSGPASSSTGRQLHPHLGMITNLIAFAAKTPEILDQGCFVQSGSKTISLSVRQVVAMGGPESLNDLNQAILNAKKLRPAPGPSAEMRQFISREYSVCSDDQLQSIFDQVIVQSNTQRIGDQVLFQQVMKNCMVEGKITRLANGYRFSPTTRFSDYQEPGIFFTNTADIKTKLKPQPKPSALTNTQTVSKVPSEKSPNAWPQQKPPATVKKTSWTESLRNRLQNMKEAFGVQ